MSFHNKRNPNAGKFVLPKGYTDLGYAGYMKPNEAALAKLAMKGDVEEFDNSAYLYRCTDVVMISHTHKCVWHVDMSD